jgi:hypothetical protein
MRDRLAEARQCNEQALREAVYAAQYQKRVEAVVKDWLVRIEESRAHLAIARELIRVANAVLERQHS